MDKENNLLLDEQIKKNFERMNELDPCSEDFKRLAESTAILIDRANDSKRIKDERIDRWVTSGTRLLGRGIELGSALVVMAAGFHFERENTLTNGPGKIVFGSLGKLLLGKS